MRHAHKTTAEGREGTVLSVGRLNIAVELAVTAVRMRAPTGMGAVGEGENFLTSWQKTNREERL